MDTPLREARNRLGLRLHEMAEVAGLSMAYLSKLERGLVSSVDLRDARRLARAYDVTLDEVERSLPLPPSGFPVASRRRPKPRRRKRAKKA
ncbi:MAG: helix-turn-helix transcriptional regulator [Acidobacteriota bacterium]